MMIHIAGLPIRIGHQKRQLCAWCGMFLVVEDLGGLFVMEGHQVPYWPPGTLLRTVMTEQPYVYTVVEYKDGDAVPAGWCGGPKGFPQELPSKATIEMYFKELSSGSKDEDEG